MSLLIPVLAAGLVGLTPPPLVFPKPAIIRAASDLGILPGFPAMLGTKKEISFVASSTSSQSSTITIPAGSKAGDLVIFSDFVYEWLADGAATGFTQIDRLFLATMSRNYCLIVRYRVLTSDSEAGTSITGQTPNIDTSKMMFTFRKSVGSWGVPANKTSQVTQGNPSAQTVGGTAVPSIVFAHYASSNSIGTRTFFPAATASLSASGPQPWHWVHYLIQNAAAASVSVDMNDEGDGNLLLSYRFPLI